MARTRKPDGAASPQPVHLCGATIHEGGHVCAFFDSRAEKYAVLAPYFAEGIANGDLIINVVEEKDRDDHVRTLNQADVPVTEAMHRGQCRLLTAEETYLKEGTVDLDEMLGLLEEALETARRDGTTIRTCGEMNWIGRSRMKPEQVLAYEARVNQFVPTFQCTLVCVYDAAALSAGMVADILATHPTSIINGELRENPYFVDPAKFLETLRQRSSTPPGTPSA